MLSKRDVQESLAGIGVAGLVSIATLSMAAMLRLAFERLSIGEGAALAQSLVLTIIAARGSTRPSAAVGTAFALGAMVAVGSAWSLSQPLVVTHARCGTGDIGVPFLLVLVGLMAAAFAFPITLVGRRFPRAALVVAVAITAAGGTVAALGVRSLAKPEPDSTMQLFEKTSIEPGEKAIVAGKSIAYDATPQPAPLLGDRKCMLLVGDEHVAVEAFDSCPTVVLAEDPKTNLVIVLREGNEPVAIVGNVVGYAPDVLGVSDLRGRLGAPRAWVFGALGGLALAFVALVMALRSRRQARRFDDAIESHHAGAGWVTVDGAPRYVPHLATRAPGPVVIVAHDASRTPTYRDDGAAKIFNAIPGNRASLREEAHARMAAWAYVAIASVVTTSAPLWVSRLFGIL